MQRGTGLLFSPIYYEVVNCLFWSCDLHLKEQNLILIIFTEETIANKYLLYGSGIENTGRNVEVCMFKPGPRAESLLLFFFVVVVGGGLVLFLLFFFLLFVCF